MHGQADTVGWVSMKMQRYCEACGRKDRTIPAMSRDLPLSTEVTIDQKYYQHGVGPNRETAGKQRATCVARGQTPTSGSQWRGLEQ